MDRTCSVEGCQRPFGTRSGGVDYCDAHYNRLRRYGDPLAGGAFRRSSSVSSPCSFEGCEQRAKSRGLCLGHYAQWAKGHELRPLRTFNFARDGIKRCPKCLQDLPLTAFAKKGDYLQWMCRPCTAVNNRAQRYGITFDEAKELIGRNCEGCGRKALGRDVHIDHCHDTGKVRGVLCRDCNHALSKHMTPEILRRLADYLEGRS